jgi:hypothetical protein
MGRRTLLLQSSSRNRTALSGRWVEPSKRDFPRKCWIRITADLSGSWHASPPGLTWNSTKRGQTEDNPRAFTQPAAHPAAISQNGRRLPALRSGRECNGRSPPTPSRAWRLGAPDEGRCRADPHCTHNGTRRYCRFDDWSFDIEHAASRVRARSSTRGGTPRPFASFQVRDGRICHTELRAGRHDDDNNFITTTGTDHNNHDATAAALHCAAYYHCAGNDNGPTRRCSGSRQRRHQRRHRGLVVHPAA